MVHNTKRIKHGKRNNRSNKNNTKNRSNHAGGMIKTLGQAAVTVGKSYGEDYLKSKSLKVAEGVYNNPSLLKNPKFMVTGNKSLPPPNLYNVYNKENINPNVFNKYNNYDDYDAENSENINPNIKRSIKGNITGNSYSKIYDNENKENIYLNLGGKPNKRKYKRKTIKRRK